MIGKSDVDQWREATAMVPNSTRGRIVDMKKAGRSVREISLALELASSTVALVVLQEMRKTNIYFLLAEEHGLVKIGQSIDVDKRIETLRCGSPCRLTLVGVLADAYFSEEGELHKKFARLWRHGEWFSFEGALFEYVKSLPRPPDRLLSYWYAKPGGVSEL